MKKIVYENRWKLIFSSIVILIPQVIVFFMKENLYYLPLEALVIHWLCLLITFADWRKRDPGRTAMNLVVCIMPVISIAGSAFILLVKSRKLSYTFAPLLMYLGIGLMFILIGNYLPKVRQNSTMGIKVKWALEDEENWNATHRFGGKVWVVCGFICMLCALLPFSGIGIGIFVAAVIGAAGIPTVYSWMYYRKRLQTGKVMKTKVSRRAMLVTGILTVFTVVFVVWVLLSGNMAIRYQENGFVIDASGWGDYKVNYEEIESIDYEPNGIQEGENDQRTNGFGNLKMAMGRFYNDSLGDYIRYTFNDCKSCVVLQVNGETVVINGEDEAATEKIYNTLKDKCEELQTALS